MTSNSAIVLPHNPELIIDASLSEIIGTAGIAAVLELVRLTQVAAPKKSAQIGNIFAIRPLESALESIYGSQAGAGIAFRAGKVSFKYFLSMFGDKLGFSDINFRLLPMNRRKLEGLSRISSEFRDTFGLQTTIRDKEAFFFVEIRDCFECAGETSAQPSCHFIAGFLQEFLAWIGGGRFYPVKESSCMAKGDKCCSFELSKQAVE